MQSEIADYNQIVKITCQKIVGNYLNAMVDMPYESNEKDNFKCSILHVCTVVENKPRVK